MARHALGGLAWTAALWLLWLLLISTRTGEELLVGLGAAAVAGMGATIKRAVGLPVPRPRARVLAGAWRLPWEAASSRSEPERLRRCGRNEWQSRHARRRRRRDVEHLERRRRRSGSPRRSPYAGAVTR